MDDAAVHGKEISRVSIPDFRLRDDWVFLLLILLLAAALRLDFLLANHFVIDSDEAIVGLMAKHILEGRGVPAFYYGQHYMGSLEPLLTAGVFAVAGISSAALKSVPLLCSLIFVVLVYQLGLDFGSRAVARSAALFAALPPQLLVLWSSMARGGYMEILCIGTLASILLLRWLRTSRPTPMQTSIISALLGLGWWVNNQILYFMLPAGICILLALYTAHKHSMRDLISALMCHGAAAVLAFVVGGAPFWFYNVRNDFVSFGIVKAASAGDLTQHIEGLFSASIPMLLGARRQWHKLDVFPGASMVAFVLYAILFGLVMWRRRSMFARLARLQISRREPIEFFFLLLVTIFSIFAISSFGSLVQSPRYLLPAYVAIFLISGCAIAMLASINRLVAAVVMTAVLTLNALSWYWGGRALPGEPFVHAGERVSKDHSELLSWLARKEIDFVRTNYWIGYRLAFETNEKVRFTIFREPRDTRIPEYEQEAKNRGKSYMPLVLVPSQAALVKRAFDVQGLRYESERVSGYEVLYNVQPSQISLTPLEPSWLSASSTDGQDAAALAVDGNVATRWGSAAPQRPGMAFHVTLPSPKLVRGLRYELGSWTHDQPRELGIEIHTADGARKVLLDPRDWDAVQYTRDQGTAMMFTFDPVQVKAVVLTQMGTQRIFDWSIAELELFK